VEPEQSREFCSAGDAAAATELDLADVTAVRECFSAWRMMKTIAGTLA
jgi:hypothetical protein